MWRDQVRKPKISKTGKTRIMKLITRCCSQCSATYTASVKKMYCSDKCSSLAWYKRKSLKRLKNREWRCNLCDVEFSTLQKFNQSEFCTNKCKKIARVLRSYGKPKEVYKIWNTVNQCQVCFNDFKNLTDKCVDHCHHTGYIRGILCQNCNTAFGRFKDDHAIVESALQYLNGEYRDNFTGEYA